MQRRYLLSQLVLNFFRTMPETSYLQSHSEQPAKTSRIPVLCLVIAYLILGAGAFRVSAQAQQPSVSPIIFQATSGIVGAMTDVWILAQQPSGSNQQPISFSTDVALEGRVLLSNPTVFFPREWLGGNRTTLLERSLTRLNDSVYTFAVRFRCASSQACDSLLRLRGEILAPSDSVCTIRLYNMRLTDSRGSRGIASTSAVLRVESIGTPLPIIRVPSLTQNAPNPVMRGESTSWGYRIDEASDVTFSIFTTTGQEIARLERKNQPRGAHTETWAPIGLQSGGVYYVRFSCSTGEIWQRCVVY